MAQVVYQIVQHDSGWAYKVGDVISETYPTRELAHAAASRAAEEQRLPGATSKIEYEDDEGRWRDETAEGKDRPDTEVKD